MCRRPSVLPLAHLGGKLWTFALSAVEADEPKPARAHTPAMVCEPVSLDQLAAVIERHVVKP